MAIIQKELRKTFNDIAKQHNIPYELVEKVYLNVFGFVHEAITKGEKNKPDTFESVLIRHFGTFYANRKHINKLKEIADGKDRCNQ